MPMMHAYTYVFDFYESKIYKSVQSNYFAAFRPFWIPLPWLDNSFGNNNGGGGAARL